MNLATTKERIIQFIEYQNITVKKFLTETGIKRGFLDTDKLKASVSDIFIAKIIAVYPDINIEWLLTGKGSMLRDGKVSTYSQKEDTQHVNEDTSTYNKTNKTSDELIAENYNLKDDKVILMQQNSALKDDKIELIQKNAELKVENITLKQKLKELETLKKTTPSH